MLKIQTPTDSSFILRRSLIHSWAHNFVLSSYSSYSFSTLVEKLGRMSMPQLGFEPFVTVFERPKSSPDRGTNMTGIGRINCEAFIFVGRAANSCIEER
jgi:hypothetical protein